MFCNHLSRRRVLPLEMIFVRRVLLRAVLLPWLSLSACSGDTVPSQQLSRDSAGVRLIELAPEPLTRPNVVPGNGPIVVLGDDDQDAYQLFRVVGGLLLPNSRVALANAGTSEVLVFDSAGGLIQRLGRAGSGPGEFAGMQWIATLPPDSIAVGDARLRRITIFALDGGLARTVDMSTLPADAAAESFAPEAIGIFGDGSVAVASHRDLQPVAGPGRRLMSIGRYLPAERRHQPIGSWPAAELYLLPAEGRLQVLTPAFARSTIVKIADSIMAVADTNSPEVRLFSPEGRSHGIIRWQKSDERPVTDAVFEAVVRDRLRNIPIGPALQQRIDEHRRMAIHATMPSFGAVYLESADRIWFSRFGLPDDTVAVWFGTSLAGDNDNLYRMHLPAGMELLALAGDQLLVLVRDSLDRETVHRYQLTGR